MSQSLDEKSQRLGQMLAQIRNALQGATEAIDAYTNFLGKPMEPTSFVKEETFTILKFELAKSERLGEYEVALKSSNLPDKWSHAYNILRQNNAVINSRYSGPNYRFSYWLYGENRIYRQRLKAQG
ncbi:hypothetical protein KEJ15_01165 [Candidatus Bathyarchaeota archaeon]|nr:hypothetical protein [Candidatus Bathyarchaeota archaeon]